VHEILAKWLIFRVKHRCSELALSDLSTQNKDRARSEDIPKIGLVEPQASQPGRAIIEVNDSCMSALDPLDFDPANSGYNGLDRILSQIRNSAESAAVNVSMRCMEQQIANGFNTELLE